MVEPLALGRGAGWRARRAGPRGSAAARARRAPRPRRPRHRHHATHHHPRIPSSTIPEPQFQAWLPRFAAARSAVAGRAAALDAARAELEIGLTLLGATAIEDKLQEVWGGDVRRGGRGWQETDTALHPASPLLPPQGVGDTIATLTAAGVRVWMLTGDKAETAVNVGVAARLVGGGQARTLVVPRVEPPAGATPAEADAVRAADVAAQVGAALAAAAARAPRSRRRVAAAVAAWWTESGPGAGSMPPPSPTTPALVVDGAALGAALGGPDGGAALLDLALASPAVIFCRVSPLQKATIARQGDGGRGSGAGRGRRALDPSPPPPLPSLLRQRRAGVTLAIGDGANDVGMIQAADVGVGVAGNEGMQAVMAADVSVARFRFLVDLLLVHGRWSYRRIALVIW